MWPLRLLFYAFSCHSGCPLGKCCLTMPHSNSVKCYRKDFWDYFFFCSVFIPDSHFAHLAWYGKYLQSQWICASCLSLNLYKNHLCCSLVVSFSLLIFAILSVSSKVHRPVIMCNVSFFIIPPLCEMLSYFHYKITTFYCI